MADPNPPYSLYGSFNGGTAGCGAVMSVDGDGTLVETIQNYTYASDSGTHGMALSPDSAFLFSADDSGNALWSHAVDAAAGGEVALVGELAGPSDGADPRHVAAHPNGTYLYVVLEAASEVAQYRYDAATGVPAYTNVSYSLLEDGLDSTLFWGDEVALSASGRYLWASTRGRSSNGFIAAYALADDGAIEKQKFLLETSSGGGAANAVAPSPFSDRFVAITDSDTGFVEIWEMSENGTSAAVVAHLDVVDSTTGSGCCANAVWYS